MASSLFRTSSLKRSKTSQNGSSSRPSSPFRKVSSSFRRSSTMPVNNAEKPAADEACDKVNAREECGDGTCTTPPPPAPVSPESAVISYADAGDANNAEETDQVKGSLLPGSNATKGAAPSPPAPVNSDNAAISTNDATGTNQSNDDLSWDNYVEGRHLAATTETIVTEDCTETVIETITDATDFKSGGDYSTMYESTYYMKSGTTYTKHEDGFIGESLSDVASAAPSEAPSESSIKVLMRYMGLGSTPYMSPTLKRSSKKEDIQIKFIHDLQEGDHVIRWKMLGYCYPIQVHGIVFSVGPDFVTIVDCGVETYNNLDVAGNFDEQDKKQANKKTRKRLNIVTLVDEKEIKKWTKIRYGEEVELKVHSSNEEMQQQVNEKDVLRDCAKKDKAAADTEESPSAGLEMEEVEKCVQAKIKPSPTSPKSSKASSSSSWMWDWYSCRDSDNTITEDAEPSSKPVVKETPKQNNSQKLRLPKADPPGLVLARLRFLLEYGEEPWPPPSSSSDRDLNKKPRPNLLPPNHLLYANSECIAVFCKTGRWSTLQASIFLHSSTVGNAKQTATLAMFLSAQTVTVPASGFWGFFGGTTTISLFTAQPWLVPALVGGGFVYVGLPTLMLWKAKGRWGDTEKKLNHAFWSMYNPDATVEMIRCYSGLEG